MVQQLYVVKKQPKLLKSILFAGLVAGTLDASFASIHFYIATHNNPVMVFWYIASAIFNSPPLANMAAADSTTQFLHAAAGLLLHYFIAYCWVTILFFAYPTAKKILGSNIIIAIVYGCLVWLVMNYVVVPLFFEGHLPTYTWKTILGVSYLIIAIGLIGSVFAGRYYARRQAF